MYLAEPAAAVVVSDRSCWAAAVTGRLDDHDPVMVGAFLSLGYPAGAATPFRGVRALAGDRSLRVTGGRAILAQAGGHPAEAGDVAGGRRVAAALAAADVPFRARTHGFAGDPDVIIAGMIAERLGLEHTVTEPRHAAAGRAPDQAEVLSRLRSAVLVSDGMLSAFENVGSPVRPDREVAAEPAQPGAARLRLSCSAG